MGDRKQNKRRKNNKNGKKENISPHTSPQTSPQESVKRKTPKARKFIDNDGGRVTRSRKTDNLNDAGASEVIIEAQGSVSSMTGTPRKVHGNPISSSTVSREKPAGSPLKRPKPIPMNVSLADMGGPAERQRELVPENWEDSELFFSSQDDSIEEVDRLLDSGSTKGMELAANRMKENTGNEVFLSGSRSVLQSKSAHDNNSNPQSTLPTGNTIDRDASEGEGALLHHPNITTPVTVHNIHTERARSKEYHKDSIENTCNEKFASNIMDTLAAMNAKLQKIDVIESLALETKKEVSGVNSRIDNISKQLQAVKADLRNKESKWETGVSELRDKVAHMETGCSKLENKWVQCKGFLKKELDIAQSSLDSNSTRLGELEQEFAEYKEKMAALENMRQTIIEAAEQKVLEKGSDIEQKVQKQIRADLQENQRRASDNDQYDKLKDRARANKNNLLIFGIPESNGTDSEFKLVTDFFKDKLGLRNIGIQNAFRLGSTKNPTSGRSRPIMVKFSNSRDRWAVWNKKAEIKRDQDNPVWIQEDQPRQLRMDIRKLQRIVKIARKYPDLGEVKIKDYGLSVNGQLFNMNELHNLPDVISLESAYTPRSGEVVIFFTKNSPLSNHHSSPFSLEGQRFVCVEQFLAVNRAFLAKDRAAARRAMSQSDPVRHKFILNSLREDQPELWREKAQQIILDATRAKFNQNPHLSKFLIDTYPLRIGEASRDEFWGTGLTLENVDAMDPAQWSQKGNLLGRTLEQVRSELMANACAAGRQDPRPDIENGQ